MNHKSSVYNPRSIEEKIYAFWMQGNYFYSTPNEKPAYTIVIPPPNVTGVLHMGHMLNNTLQDVLIRQARMRGYNACWVPGTDHASIATEAKVVEKLKKQGIKKTDIGREVFLKHAWDWTHKHGGVILEQLKKLGASCDWHRTKFTLDEDLSKSVTKAFIDLYDKGLIYRGYRMVNWDPKAQTTISDEEVIYEEHQGALYYITYDIENEDASIIIATTRPETLLGDTALAINPNDTRYTHLKGKRAIVPIVGRSIPIIQDDYVDADFGTGALKVTPAHDFNDKILAEKHSLEIIDIFDNKARLNANGLHHQGKDRFVAREDIVKELQKRNQLVKTEKHQHKVGTSERTKAFIEPKLSVQWFLKMGALSKPALEVVLDKQIALWPHKFINTYKHWMQNVHDWNISRQLWWGHRIPAWFYGPGDQDFVIAKTEEEAIIKAKQKTQNPVLTKDDLTQDPDVLDTWFSSWLWPLSVFDGICNPKNKEVNYYYPTMDLVTGPDILFFWVARMIMAGLYFHKEIPFKNVYLTGIVRDKSRRKMSKSLGNSPDALALIDEYGADAVRVGLLLSTNAGNDLLFDESLCVQGRNFANKIWNAFRLFKGWSVVDQKPNTENLEAIKWFKNQINKSIIEINNAFEKYRLSEALMIIYKLIWDDFCAWYLEIIKPAYGKPIDSKTLEETKGLFETLLKLLHPFMPFLSEEIWQQISQREQKQALIVASWPLKASFDEQTHLDFEHARSLITAIRNFKKTEQISPKTPIDLSGRHDIKLKAIVKKMAPLINYESTHEKPTSSQAITVEDQVYYIAVLKKEIDAKTRAQIESEITYLKGFLNSIDKKLNNERFMQNAPSVVIDAERKKQTDALRKIGLLEQSLQS